ncbi:DNA polymerase IV [Tepidimonas charontis]|uniref:DNA polymerase IV n=1 Tax=Tepidimonas charontis TaxID=2267262 RepID=A0A554WXP2_9BURK|nr:DNA polymerase IV [Tepidimonas charontis]
MELLRYPDLRGQPVVIGGGHRHQPELLADGTRRYARLVEYAGRGVITTATYEARALGVHSGMGLMKAAALAPEVVLLPTDFNEYRRYSRLFKAAVAEIAPQIEDRGIDEIYIDPKLSIREGLQNLPT